MKKFALPAGERKRYLFAMGAGLVFASAFPKLGVAGAAWVAPGLMLLAATGHRGGGAFRIGYVAGLAHFLATLYWLLWIPVRFAPIAGWLALAAYLAVFPALWVWLAWATCPIGNAKEDRRVGAEFDRLLSCPWSQRFLWTISCAALWVALEMVQARLFSGFPWNFAGVSQYRLLPLIQIASITGVYGVSFGVVWFSVSLVCTAVALLRKPQHRWNWQRELILPLLLLFAIAGAGWQRLMEPAPERPTLKIALVQPSIPQKWVWDPAESSRRFAQLLELSEQALTNRPDLLVWPEAAAPYMLRFDEPIYTAVTNLARAHQTWLVLGSDDAEVRALPGGAHETHFFNSSFLVTPRGELAANYRKRRLVIFGEYYPLKKWLPFLDQLSEFTPGPAPVPFTMPALQVKTSVLICFEDVFPHLARDYVEDDTDFLLNLTNNGWFGESAAQWQHAANAVFRALENGLPLVRCANNGLTCWVDARGRLLEVHFPGTTDIYGAGFKIVRVPLLAGRIGERTFYRRHGDWFGWSCVAISLGAVIRRFGRRPAEERAMERSDVSV